MEQFDEVSVIIGSEYMTLYHLGYLSEDIGKALVLAQAAHESDLTTNGPVSRFDPLDSLEMFRNDPRFVEHMGLLRIERVRPGSIEIVIAAASLLAAVVVPVLLQRVQQRGAQGVTFEVRSSHPMVAVMLERYRNGEYGQWPESLQVLCSNLERVGVDMSARSPNAYVLVSVIDRYAVKIARIMQVPGR
ncbi:hypothetical protein LVB77_10005 [Lysobacter sp. 5GHs7-4]|uniref:hypothetical protein n=1 Tax=Lysobacter sp. 5GHs7-4 TaxID=2904253 RepID=UPI001E5CECC7|nr:hypothetical protein [Lysobacter sp. 5GHs7-4]UHQ24975.1 hypothetical protein LVB77_10005 [Lysobacter sp. 5GHs7-4]